MIKPYKLWMEFDTLQGNRFINLYDALPAIKGGHYILMLGDTSAMRDLGIGMSSSIAYVKATRIGSKDDDYV